MGVVVSMNPVKEEDRAVRWAHGNGEYPGDQDIIIAMNRLMFEWREKRIAEDVAGETLVSQRMFNICKSLLNKGITCERSKPEEGKWYY
jgi:hypothetical protein